MAPAGLLATSIPVLVGLVGELKAPATGGRALQLAGLGFSRDRRAGKKFQCVKGGTLFWSARFWREGRVLRAF